MAHKLAPYKAIIDARLEAFPELSAVVSVADDGSVRYESTGGMPSVMSAEMGLAAAPANHGLVAMDRFTVAPGASEERGNVEVHR